MTATAPDGLVETSLEGLAPFARGKVRDLYAVGDDRLLIVATDRISAFDAVLATPIPDKGKVLNQLSAFWFERTAGIVPNHLLSIDVGSAPLTTHVAGTGDFNGDGQTDILFRGSDGHVVEWLMTSGRVTSIQDIGPADSSWNILGTADLNGDSREDILWDTGNGHTTTAWFLDNGQLASIQNIGNVPTGTQIGGSHFDLV